MFKDANRPTRNNFVTRDYHSDAPVPPCRLPELPKLARRLVPGRSVLYFLPHTRMVISDQEVAKHDTRNSCWVVVEGNVYDVTGFLESHPGGVSSILKYAGKVSLSKSQHYDRL